MYRWKLNVHYTICRSNRTTNLTLIHRYDHRHLSLQPWKLIRILESHRTITLPAGEVLFCGWCWDLINIDFLSLKYCFYLSIYYIINDRGSGLFINIIPYFQYKQRRLKYLLKMFIVFDESSLTGSLFSNLQFGVDFDSCSHLGVKYFILF